jgi:hypothetical protein
LALTIFLALMFGHFLADYPLQGEFLAKAKNHQNPLPGAPWYQALAAHSFIHAGVVFIITGLPLLFFAELVAHAVIDYRKCAGELTFNEDQALHAACKVVWTIVAVACGVVL